MSLLNRLSPTLSERTVSPAFDLFLSVVLDANLANGSHMSFMDPLLISGSRFSNETYFAFQEVSRAYISPAVEKNEAFALAVELARENSVRSPNRGSTCGLK